LTAGLAEDEDSTAVYMIYLQVVLALVADWLVWHTTPDVVSGIGSILVIFALAINEWKKKRGMDSSDAEANF
jgi:drug/metabolite transporter (DMT)-like permease